MNHSIWLHILVMASVTFCIRVIPLTVFRKPIQNRFIKSFLYYVPYVTLAVMTFPAILHATGNLYAGLGAFVIGIITTWLGGSLFQTSVICCIAAYIILLF